MQALELISCKGRAVDKGKEGNVRCHRSQLCYNEPGDNYCVGLAVRRTKFVAVYVEDHSNLGRRIRQLAWPAILEMGLHMLVGVVDTAMVGQLGARS